MIIIPAFYIPVQLCCLFVPPSCVYSTIQTFIYLFLVPQNNLSFALVCGFLSAMCNICSSSGAFHISCEIFRSTKTFPLHIIPFTANFAILCQERRDVNSGISTRVLSIFSLTAHSPGSQHTMNTSDPTRPTGEAFVTLLNKSVHVYLSCIIAYPM